MLREKQINSNLCWHTNAVSRASGVLTSWWILLCLHLNPAPLLRRVSHFLSEDPPSAGEKTQVFGGPRLWRGASQIPGPCFFWYAPHGPPANRTEVWSRRQNWSSTSTLSLFEFEFRLWHLVLPLWLLVPAHVSPSSLATFLLWADPGSRNNLGSGSGC